MWKISNPIVFILPETRKRAKHYHIIDKKLHANDSGIELWVIQLSKIKFIEILACAKEFFLIYC